MRFSTLFAILFLSSCSVIASPIIRMPVTSSLIPRAQIPVTGGAGRGFQGGDPEGFQEGDDEGFGDEPEVDSPEEFNDEPEGASPSGSPSAYHSPAGASRLGGGSPPANGPPVDTSRFDGSLPAYSPSAGALKPGGAISTQTPGQAAGLVVKGKVLTTVLSSIQGKKKDLLMHPSANVPVLVVKSPASRGTIRRVLSKVFNKVKGFFGGNSESTYEVVVLGKPSDFASRSTVKIVNLNLPEFSRQWSGDPNTEIYAGSHHIFKLPLSAGKMYSKVVTMPSNEITQMLKALKNAPRN